MPRPRIEIDRKNFEKLCGLQCTLKEIAGFFGCSEDTIERWCVRELKSSFADAYIKYSAPGKISLRRTQFRLAERYPAMAIFLGKNILGQSDQPALIIDDEEPDDTLTASLKEEAERLENMRGSGNADLG